MWLQAEQGVVAPGDCQRPTITEWDSDDDQADAVGGLDSALIFEDESDEDELCSRQLEQRMAAYPHVQEHAVMREQQVSRAEREHKSKSLSPAGRTIHPGEERRRAKSLQTVLIQPTDQVVHRPSQHLLSNPLVTRLSCNPNGSTENTNAT